MKNILTLLLLAFITINAVGQTNIPQLVSFSAVVRDANNQPLLNTPVSIRLTFKEGGQTGPLVFCALHQTTTNQNGFMSLQLNRDVLGTGCNGAPSTPFEDIPWENGGFWMEVEYQVTPGDPFENLGQLELASSFYAFAAGTAESISGMDLSGANDGNVLTYNITTGQWEPQPASGGFSGDYNDLTNQPTIPTNTSDLTNNSGFITNPDDADADSTNELQSLSVSTTGDTLYLQNGGNVIIPGISYANLEIGDSHQGGIIFYLDGVGGGLIMAPSNISGQWGCDGILVGADGLGIGEGYQNTLDIVNANCIPTNNLANQCANLVIDGYDDWYMPSRDELNLIYQNMVQPCFGCYGLNAGPGTYYVTSSESNAGQAWGMNFNSFISSTPEPNYNKEPTLGSYFSRPIRTF